MIEERFILGFEGKLGWHLDHIIPLSAFDLTDPAQFAAACHYTNLRPLHWKENLSKGKKIEQDKHAALEAGPRSAGTPSSGSWH